MFISKTFLGKQQTSGFLGISIFFSDKRFVSDFTVQTFKEAKIQASALGQGLFSLRSTIFQSI